MIERGQHLRLALEACETIIIECERLGNDGPQDAVRVRALQHRLARGSPGRGTEASTRSPGTLSGTTGRKPLRQARRSRRNLLKGLERETGIEPATSSLGSLRSTAELLPLLVTVTSLVYRRFHVSCLSVVARK